MKEKTKYITILGKEYKLPVINYAAMCDLEERGFDVVDFGKKRFRSIAVLLGFILDVSTETAMAIIDKEVEENGSEALTKIIEITTAMLTESDFFRTTATTSTEQKKD